MLINIGYYPETGLNAHLRRVLTLLCVFHIHRSPLCVYPALKVALVPKKARISTANPMIIAWLKSHTSSQSQIGWPQQNPIFCCLCASQQITFLVCIQGSPSATALKQLQKYSRHGLGFIWDSCKIEQGIQDFSLAAGNKKRSSSIVRTSERGCCGLVLQGSTRIKTLQL